MNKKIRSEIKGNLPWLLLGLFFFYFSGGDKPIEAAVWLAPIFILRFFRKTGPFVAFLITLPCWVIVDILSNKGLTPFPSFRILMIVTIESAVFTLLPYLLDRILNRLLPIPARIFLLPSLVIAIPFIQGSHGTWFHIANKIDNLTILQLVSLAGVSGISFLIYWSASIINEMWENYKKPIVLRNLLVVFLAVITFVYCFGTLRLNSEYKPTKSILAAGIIRDPSLHDDMFNTIPQILRFSAKEPEKLELIRRETKKKFLEMLSDSVSMANSGFQIAVWPEGAVILFKEDEYSMIQIAKQGARDNGIYLGISAVVYRNTEDKNKKGIRQVFDNKFILISPNGEVEFEHSKSILSPGMEAALMIPGDGIMKVNKEKNIKITAAICYELDFPHYIRQAKRLKADLILGPASDWTEIINKHSKMARLRAIENGISLFRPTANGISIAVDPYGRVLAQVNNLYSYGAPFTALLPIDPVKTVYSKLGDYFEIICTVLLCFCIALSAVNFIRHKKIFSS